MANDMMIAMPRDVAKSIAIRVLREAFEEAYEKDDPVSRETARELEKVLIQFTSEREFEDYLTIVKFDIENERKNEAVGLGFRPKINGRRRARADDQGEMSDNSSIDR